MTRRSLLASTVLAVPGLTWSRSAKGVAAAPKPLYRDPGAPVSVRVADLLSRMTLDEKVAQMLCIWQSKSKLIQADGTFDSAKAAQAIPLGIGQIARPHDTMGAARFRTTSYRSVPETVAFVNDLQHYLFERTRLGIPALLHEESAHGYLAGGATIFPTAPALASTWDPDLIEQVFTVVGREVRVRGATVALGPVLDLARDPRYGRVEEFYGEDPYLVSRMGVASVRGQQGLRPLGRDKIFVTLKHFVHGAPEGGLNISPADMSERTLRESFLVPFATVIHACNPGAVMPSYNEVEGVPSHMNRSLLQATGRERLGFRGAYFSDYDGILNLHVQHRVAPDVDAAALLALEAGVDADLPEGHAYRRLGELVRAGRASEARIDAAVGRILAMKFEAGLFENPYVDADSAVLRTNTAADVALARTVAQKALVLLKNDGILPLNPQGRMRLAVIGPNALEPLFGGYSGANPRAVGIYEGVRRAAGPSVQVEYAEGVLLIERDPSGEHRSIPIRFPPSGANTARIAAAVETARRSDVILLVVGDQPELTREAVDIAASGDRDTLGLFGDQDALVEALLPLGKPIVALLINGRALAVTRLAHKANALVEGWYLGQEGGHAFADVLFGFTNPGGKLPVTFPRSVGDLPIYYDHHPSADTNRYIEDPRRPLFPFGHGLSYTSFDISAPRLNAPQIVVGESVQVEVDVANTGHRTGDEVVQLYIRDDYSSVPRPVLELRGFQRVTLAPGERRTLHFTLGPEALAFWNIDMEFVVEPGSFTLFAGPSSAILKSAKLVVV